MMVYDIAAAGLALTLVASSTRCAEKTARNPVEYFSAEYSEARKKFLSAAREAGGIVESHKNDEEGPSGEPLFADVAIFGPSNAPNVIVVVSGTHGVEGFCGAGVQTGLIRNGLTNRLPEDTKLVFVHSLNPYGMAWFRRVNEDNVDLNRNFIEDYSNPPTNPGYDELADHIAPTDYPKLADSRKRLLEYARKAARRELAKMGVEKPNDAQRAYVEGLGKRHLQAAITRGQYRYSKGLHFGGDAAAWSNTVFRQVVKKYMVGASRVVLIDLHTGLGPYGHGACFLNEPVESEAYKRARTWWGNTVISTKAGESPSSDITGSLKYAFVRMFPRGTEVTAISLEFGTFDSPEVFAAMQEENWLHHHGGANNPRAQQIEERMLRVFYPDDENWLKMVWARANFVVDQVLAPKPLSFMDQH